MRAHNTFQPGLLRNKAVFITGGGSGINRQIALTYALAGAAVTIVGRSLEKARDAAAEIEASGGLAIGLSADVRNYEACETPSSRRMRRSAPSTSWSLAPQETSWRRPPQ